MFPCSIGIFNILENAGRFSRALQRRQFHFPPSVLKAGIDYGNLQ